MEFQLNKEAIWSTLSNIKKKTQNSKVRLTPQHPNCGINLCPFQIKVFAPIIFGSIY